MKNARKLLGVSDNASKSEIRNAFRRVASRLHPDVNTDPRAPKAFSAAVAAYRALMGRAPASMAGTKASAKRKRPQAVPAEFVCPACHDGYTQRGECPRCELEVHARAAGPIPAPPRDRSVEAMIESLETPAAAPWISIHPKARVPLMAASLVLCGLTQAGLGLWFLAIMSAGFGAFAMLSETHDRLRKATWTQAE